MHQLLPPERETLDFDYDNDLGYEVAYLRGYRIAAKVDECAENPFEAWDGHWPMIAYMGRHDGSTIYDDKLPGVAINQPFERFNEYELVLLQKHLAKIVGMERWDEWQTDAQVVSENMAGWVDTDPGTRTFEQWAELYDLLGIPCLQTTVRGSCQGDWAELLIVATPEAVAALRPDATPEELTADMERQAQLYEDWAFGNVYGYVVEQPCEWDEDGEPTEWEDIEGHGSCWGFYGSDHDESGLAEGAWESVPEEPAPGPPFDMILTPGHGYYDLAAVTPAGQALVDEVAAAKRTDIGTDDSGTSILLDSFFAFAGDWCKDHALPRGLRVKWGDTIYAGDEGIAALNEECM